MSDRKIYKPKPISGFPEWLPEYRRVEQQWLDHIRRVFESYGYTNIETPAVEEIDVLTAKGEVDKEIYVLERLHKEEGDKDARLALHFDQTVPFARYVAQHFQHLAFPFKRYQMQKVWRGERPQLGRMREFYQCDIDVIGIDNLPLHFDAEMPAVIYECLMGLNIGRVQIRISNRKIISGFLEANGLTDAEANKCIIAKFDKADRYRQNNDNIGVFNLVMGDISDSFYSLNPNPEKYGRTALEPILYSFYQVASQTYKSGDDLKTKIEATEHFDLRNEMLSEGIDELCFVANNLQHLSNNNGVAAVVIDLGIFRGLDYYTGTVYETRLLDVPDFTSSIVSGGRYDDLAGSYINKHLPGVGISIGLSRLFDVLKDKGIVQPSRKSPTDVLVILPSEDMRAVAASTAQTLRARGLNVELFHKPAKLGDQIKYAENKNIPFVWIVPFDKNGAHAVKNLTTREQTDGVNPATWQKPA